MSNYQFADIILPFAVRGRFTYRIPVELSEDVTSGVMVTVQFGGRNLYSGIVCTVHNNTPDIKNIKSILKVNNNILSAA